jgi:hypothetical protein
MNSSNGRFKRAHAGPVCWCSQAPWAELERLVGSRQAAARSLTHARILLKADEGAAGPRWIDDMIAAALDVNRTTVERVRVRCVEEGVEAAVRARPSRQLRLRTLDGAQEAHLVALACSKPPTARARWSMRLLADKLVELDHANGPVSIDIRRADEGIGRASEVVHRRPPQTWPGHNRSWNSSDSLRRSPKFQASMHRAAMPCRASAAPARQIQSPGGPAQGGTRVR